MEPLRLLLDTHVLLWWFENSIRIKESWRVAIAKPDTIVFVSVVSLWEIVMKARTGKLRVRVSDIEALVERNRFAHLPITTGHLLQLERLPRHHRDPFDHLLIAQAVVEDALLVSADAAFAHYPVQRLESHAL